MDLWSMIGISQQVGLRLLGGAAVLTAVVTVCFLLRARGPKRTLVNLSGR